AKIDNARITTTGDATIRASVDHTMKVSGKASSVENVPFQGAAAVSVISSSSTAEVTPGAVLNVGRQLFVQSDTLDRNSTVATTAESTPDGKVSVAVAVSVEDGNTNAYLDGQANVAGSINVTAKQQKEPINKNVAYIVPGIYTGVSASAGLGGP